LGSVTSELASKLLNTKHIGITVRHKACNWNVPGMNLGQVTGYSDMFRTVRNQWHCQNKVAGQRTSEHVNFKGSSGCQFQL
jgi:hypothetical protein